jgi:hypothetical protein
MVSIPFAGGLISYSCIKDGAGIPQKKLGA